MSMTEVAKMVGVSHVTVSRVVNGQRGVSNETIRKVKMAMQALGYNPAPRHRRQGPRGFAAANSAGDLHDGRIAVVLMDEEQSLHPWLTDQLCRGVELGAASHGLSVSVVRMTKSPGDANRQALEGVDGVLLVGGKADSAALDLLHGLPAFWMTSHATEGAEAVLPGNELVGRIAADHLLSRDYRRLAFISAKSENPSYVARGKAFRHAAEEGGAFVEVITCKATSATIDLPTLPRVEQRMAGLIERFVALPERPQAIFFPSDLMTSMAYGLLQQRGIRPGEDVAIISCDNEAPYLAGLFPKPATIDIGMDLRGQRSVDQLLWMIRNPDQTRGVQITIDPILIEPS